MHCVIWLWKSSPIRLAISDRRCSPCVPQRLASGGRLSVLHFHCSLFCILLIPLCRQCAIDHVICSSFSALVSICDQLESLPFIGVVGQTDLRLSVKSDYFDFIRSVNNFLQREVVLRVLFCVGALATALIPDCKPVVLESVACRLHLSSLRSACNLGLLTYPWNIRSLRYSWRTCVREEQEEIVCTCKSGRKVASETLGRSILRSCPHRRKSFSLGTLTEILDSKVRSARQ